MYTWVDREKNTQAHKIPIINIVVVNVYEKKTRDRKTNKNSRTFWRCRDTSRCGHTNATHNTHAAIRPQWSRG